MNEIRWTKKESAAPGGRDWGVRYVADVVFASANWELQVAEYAEHEGRTARTLWHWSLKDHAGKEVMGGDKYPFGDEAQEMCISALRGVSNKNWTSVGGPGDASAPPDNQVQAVGDRVRKIPWPDPTPEMLENKTFDAIWEAIKGWEIEVPGAYVGRCSATGNHARAIYDALAALLPKDVYVTYLRGFNYGRAGSQVQDLEAKQSLKKMSNEVAFSLGFSDGMLQYQRSVVSQDPDELRVCGPKSRWLVSERIERTLGDKPPEMVDRARRAEEARQQQARGGNEEP